MQAPSIDSLSAAASTSNPLGPGMATLVSDVTLLFDEEQKPIKVSKSKPMGPVVCRGCKVPGRPSKRLLPLPGRLVCFVGYCLHNDVTYVLCEECAKTKTARDYRKPTDYVGPEPKYIDLSP